MARGGDRKKVGGFHTPFARLAELQPAKAAEPAKPEPKAAKPAPPAPRDATHEDDESLWLSEAASATPLDDRAPRVNRAAGAPPPGAGTPSAPPRSRQADDDAAVLAELDALVSAPLEGVGRNVDRRLLRRLKAGEFEIEARLDLHGLGRDEARRAVSKWLAESHAAGRRCVLVVHGRGRHSPGGEPVLKEALRGWLQAAPSVLAWTPAQPRDGGDGAALLLLRRGA